MKHQLLIYLSLIITSSVVVFETKAQERCGTMERWELELIKNPELVAKRQKINKQIKRWKKILFFCR